MGRLTLRLPETLHQELISRAQRERISLNQYILYTLTRQMTNGYTVQVLPAKMVEQQKERFQQLLRTLGEPSVSETEAILAEREIVAPEPGLSDDLVARLQEKIARQRPRPKTKDR